MTSDYTNELAVFSVHIVKGSVLSLPSTFDKAFDAVTMCNEQLAFLSRYREFADRIVMLTMSWVSASTGEYRSEVLAKTRVGDVAALREATGYKQLVEYA